MIVQPVEGKAAEERAVWRDQEGRWRDKMTSKKNRGRKKGWGRGGRAEWIVSIL